MTIQGQSKGFLTRADLSIEHYQPRQALEILGQKLTPGGKEYLELEKSLEPRPGFMRISSEDLMRLGKLYEHVVNITGYSGQGVHPQQRELLDFAFSAIMADMGWNKSNSLVISGGTALGMPEVAMASLSRRGYQAVAVMALPGVAYPMSPGYSFVCADNSWVNWGDETKAMAEVSTGTILTGGGTQALNDALIAMQSDEHIAVIVNAFNGLARIPYELNGKPGELILRGDETPRHEEGVFKIHELQEKVATALRSAGTSEDELKTLKVTGLPVNGLVTEAKKGERRGCAQDLLYYAITGDQDLLPQQFRSESEADRKAFHARVLKDLNLYYLFDDPTEGIFTPSVLKLDDAIGNYELIGKLIDDAVKHDVYSSKSETFGPACLGAHSPYELAEVLKRNILSRMSEGVCRLAS